MSPTRLHAMSLVAPLLVALACHDALSPRPTSVAPVTSTISSAAATDGGFFVTLSASGHRTCGLTGGGRAFCWGSNSHGQLGDGTTTDRSTPTAVQTPLTFASVAAGYHHTCALSTAGDAYCWGANAYGQLGNGTNISSSLPVAVQGGHPFIALTAGDTQTCGLTAAGAAYCWGGNSEGAGIGDGTTQSRNTPVPVAGGLVFTAVSAGLNYTCGLEASGAVYCWGFGPSGQLGDGGSTRRLAPVAVQGGHVFTAIAAAVDSFCALTSAGATYCWGYNVYGQVGDGTTTNRFAPVAVQGGHVFAQLTAGGGQVCGLTVSGTAWCWGRNGSGEFGDGTLVDRAIPVPAGGGLTFRALFGGRQHSCGLTISGAAYCWGFNVFGTLGDGTTIQRLTPVAVLTPDATPPAIVVPADIVANAVDGHGAAVSYTVTSTDNVGVAAQSCAPASGSLFPIGETTVNCYASDAAGNTATAAFTVTVVGAAEQMLMFGMTIVNLDIHEGTETSLLAKLDAARSSLQSGNTVAACNAFDAMINQINAQSGKKLSAAEATVLLGEVNRLRSVIGC